MQTRHDGERRGCGAWHARARFVVGITVALVTGGAMQLSGAANPKDDRVVLATVTVQSPVVYLKTAGRRRFTRARNGVTLRHGDAIRTGPTGKAEVDYTDGSLTRLGPSTEFTVVRLTDKRGGRQTRGELRVGEAWNRVAKLSATSSFEIRAGHATAAVEGTAFAVECTTRNDCEFIDIVDDVDLHIDRSIKTRTRNIVLGPDTDVVVDVVAHHKLGEPIRESTLSFDDANNDAWIVQNIASDQQEGIGHGRADLPPPPTTTPHGGS
jgi:hypothetical protein